MALEPPLQRASHKWNPLYPVNRLIKYLWAAPNTLIGCLVGLLVLCLGGRARLVAGVAEFHSGLIGLFFARLPKPICFGAMTLGHVIIGVNKAQLCAFREHEHVHVRQYERWGLFFMPSYALFSLWEAAHGRRWYKNNYFERQAYAAETTQNLRLNASAARSVPDQLASAVLPNSAGDALFK